MQERVAVDFCPWNLSDRDNEATTMMGGLAISFASQEDETSYVACA
jgi:hypothetical protein